MPNITHLSTCLRPPPSPIPSFHSLSLVQRRHEDELAAATHAAGLERVSVEEQCSGVVARLNTENEELNATVTQMTGEVARAGTASGRLQWEAMGGVGDRRRSRYFLSRPPPHTPTLSLSLPQQFYFIDCRSSTEGGWPPAESRGS